jgi:hypothetical protein
MHPPPAVSSSPNTRWSRLNKGYELQLYGMCHTVIYGHAHSRDFVLSLSRRCIQWPREFRLSVDLLVFFAVLCEENKILYIVCLQLSVDIISSVLNGLVLCVITLMTFEMTVLRSEQLESRFCHKNMYIASSAEVLMGEVCQPCTTYFSEEKWIEARGM